jgi:hypothetical protein
MIDDSMSTTAMLVQQALCQWPVDGLLRLLRENDVIVRTAAARELQLRGGEEVFKEMQKFVESKSSRNREIGAFILGQLGTPVLPYAEKSLSILSCLLSDTDSEVRATAASACGHLLVNICMPVGIEEMLLRLCFDSNEDVKACAAYALGMSSGSEGVRSVLMKLIKDNKDSDVSGYAELGLELLDLKNKNI